MKEQDEPIKSAGKGEPASPEQREEPTPAVYLHEVKAHLTKGKQKEAYAVMPRAIANYPDDPLILSYFGYLQALVDKKYRSGIEACMRALALMKKKESFEEGSRFPVYYLNLGRAYVAAGKKLDAINTFNKGLKY